MAPRNNHLPVVMDSVGDEYIDGCRIMMIIWEGATSSGDTARLIDPFNNGLLWKGRTDATQTYLGASFSPFGVPAPNGFRLETLGAGTVTVYLCEA